MYSEKLIDHFQRPRNAGTLEGADGEATVTNPQCGDVTRLFIRVEDGVITDARWQTRGCSGSIAASSAASELIKGRPVADAQNITRRQLEEALGGDLPPARAHGVALALDAIKAALGDYRTRTGASR